MAKKKETTPLKTATATTAALDAFLEKEGIYSLKQLSDMGDPYDIVDWLDTGNYSLNALISGSLFKGVPAGRFTMFSGFKATGKSYLAYNVIKRNQDKYDKIIIFDTEHSVSKTQLEEFGIDVSNVLIKAIDWIEDLSTIVKGITNTLMEQKKKGKDIPKILFIIDSIGNIPSKREVEIVEEGLDKVDMTRAKMLKQFFRVITTPIGQLRIPVILINHLYKSQDGNKYAEDIQSGGTGAVYAASTIVNLTVAQIKEEDGTQTGVTVTAKLVKSRFTATGAKKKFRIVFKKAMNRFIGLQTFLKPETFKELGIGIGKVDRNGNFECTWKSDMELGKTGYVITDENGKLKNVKINEFFKSSVFTKERLEKLDKFIQEELKFANNNDENDYFDETEIENTELDVKNIEEQIIELV
ncbi:MAG: hypothetical protein FWC41_05095 [Firmicutes bacterium]|nr:hypothetical protein [Bacillota bacterium]